METDLGIPKMMEEGAGSYLLSAFNTCWAGT
jgi:hypothetical protein